MVGEPMNQTPSVKQSITVARPMPIPLLGRILWNPIMATFRLLFRLHGGYKVIGAHHIPKTGGVLICPNHVCDADPAAVAGAIRRRGRYLGKHELFETRYLGFLLRMLGGIPVHRDTADLAAVKTSIKHLKDGQLVVIFPEGGGNPEGRLLPLQPGALLMAVQAGVPVVPCAIRNTRLVMPYGARKFSKSPIPVEVEFGPPITILEMGTGKGAVVRGTEILTERLATMLGQPVPTGTHVPHAQRE